MKYWLDSSPCLTCNRAGGHWITNRGRRLTKAEMMRLQGIATPAEGFVQRVSDPQLGKQIGNAMSVNVLERIFVRLLPAAGLWPARQLQDRWEAKKRTLPEWSKAAVAKSRKLALSRSSKAVRSLKRARTSKA